MKDGRVRGDDVTERTREEKKARVLRELAANGGRVQLMIRTTRVARTTIDRWKEDDPIFAAAWDETIETCVEELEAEAWRRASGYDKPIVYQGKIQGHWVDAEGNIVSESNPDAILVQATVREFSDNLLMFMLKGHRPEKYRDGPGVGKGKFGDVSEEEMDQAIGRYMKRMAAKTPELATDSVS